MSLSCVCASVLVYLLTSCATTFSEKLKKILLLEPKTVIEYKNHSTSIKDRSSHRNGTSFIV